MGINIIIDAVYFVTAAIFIIGLKQMSSPVTAHRGIVWAGIAMVVASVATFGAPQITLDIGNINLQLMLVAIIVGSAIAYISAKRVAMTDMPQMIAMYNGMGGGAAAAIAAVELVKLSGGAESHGLTVQVLAVLGAVIGAVSFSGSVIAFAKLQGIMKKTLRLPLHQMVNIGLFAAVCVFGYLVATGHPVSFDHVIIFFVLALVLGIMVTTPIGGADMPVVISLLNSYSGLAACAAGFVISNNILIVAGALGAYSLGANNIANVMGVFVPVTPFTDFQVGRILDWFKANTDLVIEKPQDDPGVQSVTRIYNYFKQHDYKTVVMGASFRNTGEIEGLAGCDRLTISPALLEELDADPGELTRQLSPEQAGSDDPMAAPAEPDFRYDLNADAMATEKLAEGIRNFVADQVKLEQLISSR